MCFNIKRWPSAVCAAILCLLAVSCAMDKKLSGIRHGDVRADLSIPSDEDYRKAKEEIVREMMVDTLDSQATGEPLILNAIKDEATGEMVATDVISASTVVARFRNVAERFGKVNIEFDITVPGDMIESAWKLEFKPLMKILGDSTALDPVYVTGSKYRDEQMRGYMRYNRFISSILTDSVDFIHIRQLEIFLSRHFPETYAMKNDSSFVSDEVAANLFGVSRAQAYEHYTRHGLVARNDRKKSNREKMFRKYVKDPIVTSGIRLDTVILAADGNFIYRYVQEVDSRPGLKKISVSLTGNLYEDGRRLCALESPKDLDFYVSSLSTLADMTPRYVMKVLERQVYDNTHAFLDFEQGKADIDTTLPGNAAELGRIRKAVESITAREELVLDSLNVIASCSPEGNYNFNSKLSLSRAETVTKFLKDVLDDETVDLVRPSNIPENWEQLGRLVQNDSIISEASKKKVAKALEMKDKDKAEELMATLPEYRYLREKIYPRLRSVRFDFYLHRRGMLKDTIHTTEIDTVYLAGLKAIKDLDYKKAVELLRPYHDYNTALAYVSAGYNHSALNDLQNLQQTSAKTDYLMAIVLSRLDRRREALEAYRESVEKDPSMIYRANLDPELAEFVNN